MTDWDPLMTATVPIPVPHPAPAAVTIHADAILTDECLLEQVRAGGDRAYAELYRRYERDVRRFARTLVAPDDVEELTSESFAKMLSALRRGKGPVDHPVRYLMVTTRTSAISLRQRDRRQLHIRNLVGWWGPVIENEPMGMDDDLLAAFSQLSPRRRKVLWWSVVDGLSATEIGELMGVPAATVSAVLYRAKRSLRSAYLAEIGDGERSTG